MARKPADQPEHQRFCACSSTPAAFCAWLPPRPGVPAHQPTLPAPTTPAPPAEQVVTTLTTVGFGDVVAQTFLGKAVVIATICVGVVTIPVQVGGVWGWSAAGARPAVRRVAMLGRCSSGLSARPGSACHAGLSVRDLLPAGLPPSRASRPPRPSQAAQLYAEFTARRVVRGERRSFSLSLAGAANPPHVPAAWCPAATLQACRQLLLSATLRQVVPS